MMTGPAITLLRQMLSRRTNADTEATILELLADVDAVGLNEMLSDPELTDKLVASVDDHWFGPDRRSELMELVGVRRRSELGLEARAAIIHALQTGRTRYEDELLVRDLFLDTTGEDLTVLKNLLDATPNHHDLEELIFKDIDSRAIRREILAHIAGQAVGMESLEAKVLSDIDDTTICSLHDKRFPKGIIYPGVLALWEALDHGSEGEPRSLGDLTFVTARPSDILGLVENQTRSKLASLGVGTSSMLTGSLTHLLSHSGMAKKKIINITHYHRLFPEYRVLFIGDSGQGDVEVAERVLTELPGVMEAALIHDVVHTPMTERRAYAAKGIHFFDTYVGAAIAVRQLGFISEEGLAGVVAATEKNFQDVKWDNDAQRGRAYALLAADLAGLDPRPGSPSAG